MSRAEQGSERAVSPAAARGAVWRSAISGASSVSERECTPRMNQVVRDASPSRERALPSAECEATPLSHILGSTATEEEHELRVCMSCA